MKTKTRRYLLWIVALMVGVHLLTTMHIYPEFRVTEDAKSQEYHDRLKAAGLGSDVELNMELIKGRLNGDYGRMLAKRTLTIDIVSLIIIGILVVESHRFDKGLSRV